jgi:hypothetical protein
MRVAILKIINLEEKTQWIYVTTIYQAWESRLKTIAVLIVIIKTYYIYTLDNNCHGLNVKPELFFLENQCLMGGRWFG